MAELEEETTLAISAFLCLVVEASIAVVDMVVAGMLEEWEKKRKS